MNPTSRLAGTAHGAAALLCLTLAGTAAAHDATAALPAQRAQMQRAEAALGLAAEPVPVAARFAVELSPPAARGAKPAATQHATWYFVRDADRIALLKGGIGEVWTRDAAGRIGLERVFHAERTVVDYSPGELATLGVRADWTALARFVDPLELRSLALVARSGQHGSERLRLYDPRRVGGQPALLVEWLPALQLPARIVRRHPDGSVLRIELEQHAPAPPAGGLLDAARTQDYARIDAADFGDMEYEPVVRKAEAIDQRSGLRQPHAAH